MAQRSPIAGKARTPSVPAPSRRPGGAAGRKAAYLLGPRDFLRGIGHVLESGCHTTVRFVSHQVEAATDALAARQIRSRMIAARRILETQGKLAAAGATERTVPENPQKMPRRPVGVRGKKAGS